MADNKASCACGAGITYCVRCGADNLFYYETSIRALEEREIKGEA